MAFSREHAFELLQRSHSQGRLAHAYLITGPKGTGKRRLASEIAALVNGMESATDATMHPDVHFVEPESKSRRILIDQMRELERELQMRSMSGGVKVGVVVDADRLQQNAANAFLKTLEEPPQKSLVILLTEQPEALLETIISRCIEVALKLEERMPLQESQRRLATAIRDFFAQSDRSLAAVFLLVRQFSALLAEAKEAVSTSLEAEFKSEEAHYRQTTDSKDWLEEREEYYKALTEARYVGERTSLLDVLVQWWADVARHQNNAPELDLKGFEADTKRIAERMSTSEVLQRLRHVETLRENLGRSGVQEQLAIEVAFLNAFGANRNAAA